MRRNVKPHAVSQACRSSCPGASGLCFRVAAPSPHTDGSWRLADAGERRVGGRGRREGVMQLLLLDAGPLWQQTSISEPARQPVISNMVGATDPSVWLRGQLECDTRSEATGWTFQE